MSKLYFMPTTDDGRNGLMLNVANRLPGFQPTLTAITPADVAGQAADSVYFNYILSCLVTAITYGQEMTSYKNAARNGTGPTLGPLPALPVLAPAPPAVAPGIIQRFLALVARIKTSPGYTDAIGKALGIIGAEHPHDYTNAKPVLVLTIEAGLVVIAWPKGDMTGLEVHVDRGDGKGFVFLVVDTIPDYTDTFELPAGQAGLWKYMAIYRQGDDRVGQWSDVVSIAVAGK